METDVRTSLSEAMVKVVEEVMFEYQQLLEPIKLNTRELGDYYGYTSGSSYARVPFASSNWGTAVAADLISTGTVITFPTATTDWSNVWLISWESRLDEVSVEAQPAAEPVALEIPQY